MDDIETFWNGVNFEDGTRFYDYKHQESGAQILKAQHPEFELWSQGIHARSNVACADCHMPYIRDGATKISDHWVRSPLLNVNRACQTCHHFSEEEMLARAYGIQERNHELLQRAGAALMDQLDAIAAAKADGVTEQQLAESLERQRGAQWRLDFIAAENSMGFPRTTGGRPYSRRGRRLRAPGAGRRTYPGECLEEIASNQLIRLGQSNQLGRIGFYGRIPKIRLPAPPRP